MIVGVIRDLMAIGDLLSHQVGILVHHLPDHEERRPHLFLAQDVQKPLRLSSMWTVVECKGDLFARWITADHHGKAYPALHLKFTAGADLTRSQARLPRS